ncbi:hypothetical protein OC706_02065 ['Bituminaria bituminosa' little leaf phytoplasma]|uniref:Uncharacterized protein n=1 Tax=Candidatus Phytoplasma fabacearum TaxID=2982628 RepID=A0ABU8ZT22_9MOLU|nr:hypothetical protein ['Bituminaria bituminosa' little leaf phytoplasma]
MCQQRFHQKLNFSRTSNRIQYCSSNGYSLKRELQQGMNNFYNTLTAFNKRTKVLCKDCHRKITNQQIHDISKIRTIRINN